MAGAAKLRLGAKVVCSDGPAGTLTRFIVDLDTGHVTHLDVASHSLGGGHLVPISDVAEGGDEIHLSCTCDEFLMFQPDETYGDILPSQSFFDPDALVQMPMIGLGRMGMFGAFGPSTGTLAGEFTPKGETSVDRHVPARASDGHQVGHIDGLVVEPSDGHITHVLLAEGHIFGKKKQVTISIDAVLEVDADGARLSLSRDEIEALPTE